MNQPTPLTNLDYGSIGFGLLVAVLFFKPIFGGFDGFKDAFVDVYLKFFPSNWVDFEWSRLKLEIWVLLSVSIRAVA